MVPIQTPLSSSSAISFSSSLHRFAPSPLLSTLFGGGVGGFRQTTSPSPFLIRMGGGPRTYPGGVTKWQWKRMQAKKSTQLLKARLLRERQLYEMRKRTELRAAVAELERPWEVVERAPNLFSVSADDQVKALADRFQRPGGFDMWNERDGPQVFRAPDGLKSARFFPKGVVHSVKPYGIVGEEGSDDEEGAASSGDEVFVDLSMRGAEGDRRRNSGRSSSNAWDREEKKSVSEAIDIEAVMLDADDDFGLGVKDSKYIDWIDKSEVGSVEETKAKTNRSTNSSIRRQGSRNQVSPSGFNSSMKHSQVISAEIRGNFNRGNDTSIDRWKGMRPGSGNRFSAAPIDQLSRDAIGRTTKASDKISSRRRQGSGNWISPNEFSNSIKHSQTQAMDAETRRTNFNKRNVSSSYGGNNRRPGSWSRFGETPMDQLPSDTMRKSDNMMHNGGYGSRSNSRSKTQRVSLRPTTGLYYDDGGSHRDRKSTWNMEDELQEDI